MNELPSHLNRQFAPQGFGSFRSHSSHIRQLAQEEGRAKSTPARLRRGRRSEPGGQRVSEPHLRDVADPRHISVGTNQHGGGSRDRAKRRKLPRTGVFGVDQ